MARIANRLSRIVGLLLAGWVFCALAQPGQSEPPEETVAAFGQLPLQFELNRGQTDAEARYLARGPGYTFFLTPSEVVLSLRKFEVTHDKVNRRDRPWA